MEYIERFKYIKTKLVITLFLLVLFILVPFFENGIIDFLIKSNILLLLTIHTIKKDRFITGIFQLFVAFLIFLLLGKYIGLASFYLFLGGITLFINTIALFINISEYSYRYFNLRETNTQDQEKETNDNDIIYKNIEEIIEENINTNTINNEIINNNEYNKDVEEDDKIKNDRLNNDIFDKIEEYKDGDIDLFGDDNIEDIKDSFLTNEDIQNKDNWNIVGCFNPKNCISTGDEHILTEDVFNQIINI